MTVIALTPAEETPFGKFLIAILECDCDPGMVHEMTLDALRDLGMTRNGTPEQYATFDADCIAYEANLATVAKLMSGRMTVVPPSAP